MTPESGVRRGLLLGPISSLALELHEPDPEVRELIAANFAAWTAAVKGCLDQG